MFRRSRVAADPREEQITAPLAISPASANESESSKAQPNGAYGSDRDGGRPGRRRSSEKKEGNVNTWNMFGFTDGSDVDDEGGRTAYLDSVGRLSKRSANYAALRGSLGYSYSPTNKTNGWIEVSSQYEQIGLTPFEPAGGPMSSAGFGASVGLKHQILDREHSGIGLAVQAAPYWQSSRRADGTDRDIASSEFKLLGDVALVADRIFGAVNLSYTPELTRMQATVENTSSTEASAAVAGRIAENVFVGAELRNLAFYDGILCSQSLGWALYAGPTIFVSIGGKGYVGAAWSEQLASKAVGRLGPNLDPINDERHQFRIKAGYYF